MATPDPQRIVRDDRVLALTRWVSLVIIPFLVVAFVVLVPWPSDTVRLADQADAHVDGAGLGLPGWRVLLPSRF